MIAFSTEHEERARRLYTESPIVVCHDHNLCPEDLADMRRGGVTAKQVHISLDSRIWADKAAYLASRTEEIGFARRALVAIDYLYWQVEQSPDRLIIALTPADILEAKRTGRSAFRLGSEGPRLIEGRLVGL
jgi:hypothetical protein